MPWFGGSIGVLNDSEPVFELSAHLQLGRRYRTITPSLGKPTVWPRCGRIGQARPRKMVHSVYPVCVSYSDHGAIGLPFPRCYFHQG